MRRVVALALVSVALVCGLTCPAGQSNPTIAKAKDFESYAVGSYICVVDSDFVTYGGNGGGAGSFDAQVDGTKSSPLNGATGTQSLYLQGPTQAVAFRTGNRTGGTFTVSMDVLVPTGGAAEIFLDVAEAEYKADDGYPVEIVFLEGAGTYTVGVSSGPGGHFQGTYTVDQWHTYTFVINLNVDPFIYTLSIDGVVLGSSPATGSSENVIGAIEFNPGTPTTNAGAMYVDNLSYLWVDESVCVGEGESASTSVSPSASPGAGTAGGTNASPSRSPILTDPVTLVIRQTSALLGVPLSEIARVTGVAEANITVVSTSVSGRADHHARASSCFDSNNVVRTVTLLFADAGAAARLAALINSADGSVRTTNLCIATSSSASTLGSAPQTSAATTVVGRTEFDRIALGLGVGLGVGLTHVFVILLIAFCCCLPVVGGGRKVQQQVSTAPHTSSISSSSTDDSETYGSSYEADDNYY